MKRIVDIIKEAIESKDVKCLSCERVNLDYQRHIDYQDSDSHKAEDVYERPRPSSDTTKTIAIGHEQPTILRYFLDGSRRTYKFADLQVKGRYLPLIAGQIGVAVLYRGEKTLKPLREFCFFENTIVFPEEITSIDDLKELSECIKKKSGCSFTLTRYSIKEDRDPVDLGVAKIMSIMHDLELKAVHLLCDHSLLRNDAMLVKDGSLRYKNIKGRNFDITQFRNVIGLSKTFRPSFALGAGRTKKDVGAITSKLKFGERTQVFKTLEEDRNIGMWYLRIRDENKMSNPLQGIVKIECYATDTIDIEEGFDTDRISIISAHILRERNVTPYGQDLRWATHIYPVFQTESFVKANLSSDIKFEALL